MIKQTNGSSHEQPDPEQIPAVSFSPKEIEGSIQARFEHVAALCASQWALIGARRYTYGALNEAANRLASVLTANPGLASSPDPAPVALLFDHNGDVVIAMLGALKAGRIFAALSPSAPPARLENLLKNLGASLIITNTRYAALAAELLQSEGSVLNLDEISQDAPSIDVSHATLASAPAAIVYTSGSTGTPKGIIQNHRVVLHRARQRALYSKLGVSDRIALIHAYNFSELWGALLSGATLVFYDVQQQGGSNLAQWLVDERITNLHIPIELYRQLLNSLPAEAYFPDLRIVEPVGPFYRQDVERSWRYLPPHAVITSRFASTETGRVTFLPLDRTTPLPTNLIPTGFPMNDIELCLRNEAGQPAAVNEAGQIYVRSPYLPSGYWLDPALTEQVYQLDPDRPGWRICATGDWGKLRPDGMLEIIGRKDDRVKIRNHRIDLNEVGAALLSVAGIHSAVVTVHERPDGEKYLVAYYVSPARATVNDLRASLAQSLPPYMIPSIFLPLEKLPLLPNGKIDRKALPLPDANQPWGRPALDTAYLAPRTSLEERLAAIWAEVLGIQMIGVNDRFLDLGGDSLRTMQIHARLHEQWQISMRSERLFACTTITEMATAIIQHQTERAEVGTVHSLLTELETLSEQEAGQILAVSSA